MGHSEGALGPAMEPAQRRRSPAIIARDRTRAQPRRSLDARR